MKNFFDYNFSDQKLKTFNTIRLSLTRGTEWLYSDAEFDYKNIKIFNVYFSIKQSSQQSSADKGTMVEVNIEGIPHNFDGADDEDDYYDSF